MIGLQLASRKFSRGFFCLEAKQSSDYQLELEDICIETPLARKISNENWHLHELLRTDLRFYAFEMSSKAKQEHDYREDYVFADEYDYDYDYDHDYRYNDLHGETRGSTFELKENASFEQSNGPPGCWRCKTCKHANPESLSICDICGTCHNAVQELSKKGPMRWTDNDIHQASKTSLLAKSLFTKKSDLKVKYSRNVQQIKDELLTDAKFHDIKKLFTVPDSKSRTISIEPFQFDSPSPDDVVSRGKRAAGKSSEAKFNSSAASKFSETVAQEAKQQAKKTGSITQKSKELSSSALYNVKEDVMNRQTVKGFLTQEASLAERTLEGLHNLMSRTAQKSRNMTKVFPLKEYKPESWMLQELKEPGKYLLHLAIVGHVDAGKSTLMGRLLHLMGHVSQEDIRKNEREAKRKGKGSFAYAWVLDESTEERERCLTMTVNVVHFESQKFHVMILDSPGLKDFVPNMISGASPADAAILVVDASLDAFEEGMNGQGGGQTKEHAQLIRSFGVEQLIVAVNKMDVVDNCEERFSFIKSQLGSFLRRCGFKESSIIWIPLSAMKNQNLAAPATDICLNSWYSGPYLLQAVDQLQPPKRDISRPLRLPVSEFTATHSLGQVAASGKLEGGAVKVGTKVLVMPSGVVATVKAIEQGGEVCNVARAGDSADIGLQGTELDSIKIGGVLCHTDYPVPIATRIEVKVLCLDITMPILVGSQVELHVHHAKEAARVGQLLSILNPKSGLVLKKAPRRLTANQTALIEVVLDRGVCIEEYSDYKALGRVTLRASGKTMAVGIVTRILEKE